MNRKMAVLPVGAGHSIDENEKLNRSLQLVRRILPTLSINLLCRTTKDSRRLVVALRFDQPPCETAAETVHHVGCVGCASDVDVGMLARVLGLPIRLDHLVVQALLGFD